MSYDDQYDAVLSGPERVRLHVLGLTQDTHSSGGSEKWVEGARTLERFVIGDRATGVQEQIEAAYTLADKLLSAAGGDPWSDESGRVDVDIAKLRQLVKMLSGLADGPPF